MSKRSPDLIDAQQRAEAIVTALIHDDRELAADLVQGDDDLVITALILAELAASLHRWRVLDRGGTRDNVIGAWRSFVTSNREAEATA